METSLKCYYLLFFFTFYSFIASILLKIPLFGNQGLDKIISEIIVLMLNATNEFPCARHPLYSNILSSTEPIAYYQKTLLMMTMRHLVLTKMETD